MNRADAKGLPPKKLTWFGRIPFGQLIYHALSYCVGFKSTSNYSLLYIEFTLVNFVDICRTEKRGEMHQTGKGGQWHFGMKTHTGVDAESGLVHTVVFTPTDVHDVTVAGELLHGQEEIVLGDAGYQGAGKRPENKGGKATWLSAMRPGKRRALEKNSESGRLAEKLEKLKARVRAKMKHPFRVVKQQFGHARTR